MACPTTAIHILINVFKIVRSKLGDFPGSYRSEHGSILDHVKTGRYKKEKRRGRKEEEEERKT